MILSKKDFLKPVTLISEVNCPGLGGTVRLKAMSAGDRDVFEQRMGNLECAEKDVKLDMRAMFLIHCIVDESDNLMFGVDDLELLSAQNSKDIEPLFQEAQRINGFLDDEDEIKKK